MRCEDSEAMRYEYENTDTTVIALAKKYGVHRNTINYKIQKEKWRKYLHVPSAQRAQSAQNEPSNTEKIGSERNVHITKAIKKKMAEALMVTGHKTEDVIKALDVSKDDIGKWSYEGDYVNKRHEFLNKFYFENIELIEKQKKELLKLQEALLAMMTLQINERIKKIKNGEDVPSLTWKDTAMIENFSKNLSAIFDIGSLNRLDQLQTEKEIVKEKMTIPTNTAEIIDAVKENQKIFDNPVENRTLEDVEGDDDS